MASFTPSKLVGLTLFLAVFAHPSSSVPDQTLVAICSNTRNLKSCESVLRSDPRTASADLPKLSLISINLTSEQAASNSKSFVEFRENTTDPSLKKGFNSCVEFYKLMEGDLDEAYHRSERRGYRNNGELIQSTKQAEYCAAALPINSETVDALTRIMVSKCETSISVNHYIGK